MKTRSLKFLILAATIIIMLTAQAKAQTDWWPMFHHDSTNSGYSTTTAPDRGCIRWCFESFSFFSSPVVADGKVYVPAFFPEDHLNCYDAETGYLNWYFPAGLVAFSAPAVVNGKVYIATSFGDILCLDAETGYPIWSYPTGGTAFSSPSVAYDHNLLQYMVYIGTDYGDILCLDADYGYFNWAYTTGGAVYSSPAVLDGKVYVGSYDGNVYCLDADYPDPPLWTYTTGGGVFSSPAVTDSTVYIGSFDGNIYCLDADYPDPPLWTFPTGDTVWSSPAIAYGMVYVGSDDGNVYCLNAESGNPEWVFPTYPEGSDIFSSPAVADSVVWVGDKDGSLYCLDALDGEILWVDALSDFVASSPAIADGKVYVTAGWYLYALGSEPYSYDIAINDITPSRTTICRGDSITVDVTVGNPSLLCTAPRSLNCVLYYDELPPPTPEQLQTFWSMGDINRECYIDTVDFILMGEAWNSEPGDCNWNANADLNGNLVVDAGDVFILSMNKNSDIWSHFGLGGPTPVAKKHVFDLMPWTTEVVSFEWNTSDVGLGAHTISAYVSYVPNEVDTVNNYSEAVPVTLVSTFTLTITATEGQTTDPAPGTYPCPCNTDTLVEAVPDFWFSYWTLDGDSTGTDNPCSLFMGDNHTLHAVFKSPCGEETFPPKLALYQNYPNPFNPFTTIAFSLPRDSHVLIEIFDTSGRLVKVLENGIVKAGRHEVIWDGKDGNRRAAASGVYFCRLRAGSFIETSKMVILR